MRIIQTTPAGVRSLPTKELTLESLASLKSRDVRRIIGHLLKTADYPRHIAAVLELHEQNVYYHIKQLLKAGVIKKIADAKSPMGFSYVVSEPSVFVRFAEFKSTSKIGVQKESTFLQPFIVDGSLNASIIVGSPDPHGPHKARSRDGYYGIDLALFLGTFLNYIPTSMVKLDTEVHEKDLLGNLILLGGPIVNSVTAKLNDSLPIKFSPHIYSKLSKKSYETDETGMILKSTNPLDKTKSVLIIAGNRYAGTRAAILAVLKHFDEIKNPNKFNQKIYGHVVEGVDLDSDGMVDDVEFLE